MDISTCVDFESLEHVNVEISSCYLDIATRVYLKKREDPPLLLYLVPIIAKVAPRLAKMDDAEGIAGTYSVYFNDETMA